MASAAAKAAKEELDINSPSKVFRAIGAGVPEGFAQGISRFRDLVVNATSGMTDTAIGGTKRAISSISDMLGGDINTQPTIKPVVDLSNVKTGVAAISGMFSANPSMELLTNIGSINSTMNRRLQNRDNNDVVSAINDLKKAIGNNPSNVYQIGDVSYGDDSAISNAVLELIGAITRERRT